MRELLVHRPLVLLAIGMTLGVAAVGNWFAAVLLLSLLIALRDVKGGLACGLGFAIGAAIAPVTDRVLFPKQWVDLNARVISVPKVYPDEITAEISTGNTKLQLSGPPGLAIQFGQAIHVKGNVKPLAVGSERLADRGIVGRIWAERFEVVKPAPWYDRFGQTWRDSFVAFADRTLPRRASDVVAAVCFNVQSRLDPDDREAFSRAGTVHAISASGLHVGLIALALFGLLSLLPIPRSAQLGIVACVLAIYALASGLHPPVVRAAIMAVVLAAAYLVRREPDLLSAVALAVVVQILIDPTVIYDVGFQLTFVVLTAVGLFPFYKQRVRIAPRYRYLNWTWQKVGRAVVVLVAAAPIVAYQFGIVSLTSLAANAALIVALPVLIVGALATHLLSSISVALASGLMTSLIGPLAGWLLFVTDHLGGEWAAVSVPAFSGYWLLAIYGAFLLVWRPRLRPA